MDARRAVILRSAEAHKETHVFSDKNRGPLSLHHTLGNLPWEAAPGNHKHSQYSATDHTHEPSAWENLTLTADWAIFGSGYAAPRIRRGFDGLIVIQGLVRRTAAWAGGSINVVDNNIPVAYRPTGNHIFNTRAYVGTGTAETQARVVIRSDGDIEWTSAPVLANNGWISLSGISYYVDS